MRKKEQDRQQNSNKTEKRSVFQITCIVLTVILVVAIIVQIGVMIWLQNKTKDLQNKNDHLSQNLTASICVDDSNIF